MKLEEDGRIFTVESVDYSAGEVELRDDTFVSHRGFPIFRNEPVSYVREWVEQQRDADLTAAAEGKEPPEPGPYRRGRTECRASGTGKRLDPRLLERRISIR